MTAPPVTIEPDAPVSAAARRMAEHGVKRLPVVDDGQLVGIITRADLVRAFVRSDAEIAQEIREGIVRRDRWIAPGRVHVSVRDGEVELEGRLETELDAELLPRLARAVPGVVSVSSSLTWDREERRVA